MTWPFTTNTEARAYRSSIVGQTSVVHTVVFTFTLNRRKALGTVKMSMRKSLHICSLAPTTSIAGKPPSQPNANWMAQLHIIKI
ncbi:unnamed protein product [Protopolystoma xenopodis]|uniref:Uncharacterized protein n=1 Tax=Protopolystoma xenopodis TaxID=117903 RepID=A0A3S5A8F8_9PLAT|nr:unnamed protein product [Protopolystoma xenopodis]